MKRRARLLSIGLSAVLPLATLAACGGDAEQLVGYQIDPAPAVGHFTTADGSQDGAPFPLRAQPGGLLIAFIGFTYCPDACPTALSEVRIALERLGEDAALIDVAMLIVDPSRDTPEILTESVQQFVDDAHALRAEDPTQLQAIVDAFGATYAAEHDHEGNTTDVGHTDYTYLLDEAGTVVRTWTAEMTIDDLVNDLHIMLGRQP